MATFKYASDVGVPSYHEIEAFERKSGIAFSVTSTTGGSHASGSYHYKGNAIDTASSAGSMQQLAAWLYGYAPYILELIHSGGSGYFVKNGVKVGASYYGAATVSQHYNHVHCAMTLSGLAAANGANPSGTQVQNVALQTGLLPSFNGCAFPVAGAGAGIVAVVGGLLLHDSVQNILQGIIGR